MICSRCREDQPRDQFGPAADRYPTRRECKTCSRRRSQKRRHGVDAEERAAIAAAQGGCRICGHDDPGPRGWVVDHDHECCEGEDSCPKCRRGVLCQWCNWVIGHAFNRPQILRAAADYLDAPRSCSWHMPIACADSICTNGLYGQDELTESPANGERKSSGV